MSTAAPVDYAPEETVTATLRSRVALLSVTRARSGDGVAYVARLVERALTDLAGRSPDVIDLDPGVAGRVSLRERARFLGRLLLAALHRGADWMFYTHVGVARAHRWLPRAVRRPFAVFVHGIEVWDGGLTPARLLALRNARLRIANSEFTARRLVGAHPELAPVEACPLALLPDEDPVAGAADDRLLARAAPGHALIVGRMNAAERYKGHDELLECWNRVRAIAPGAQLVVVGEGNDRVRLMEKAAAHGLSDCVLFTGRVSDATLRALLRRAGLMVLPSRGEGFGLVYLEAMRAGLPCVAAADTVAANVVIDGVTGLLVDPSDPEALAAAIAGLVGDDARRASMGSAGRRRYEEHFTYERFRERLAAIVGRALPDLERGRT